jgi:hypothetical protein
MKVKRKRKKTKENEKIQGCGKTRMASFIAQGELTN